MASRVCTVNSFLAWFINSFMITELNFTSVCVFCSLACFGQIWVLEVQVSCHPRENLEQPTTLSLVQISAEDHFMTHQLLVSNTDSF